MDREFLTLEEYVNEAVSHGRTNSYKTEIMPHKLNVESLMEWLDNIGVELSKSSSNNADTYHLHKDYSGYTMVNIKFPKGPLRKEGAVFSVYYNDDRKLVEGYKYSGNVTIEKIVVFSDTKTGTEEYFKEIYQYATGEIR